MKIYLGIILTLASISCFGQQPSPEEVFNNVDAAIRKISTISHWIDYKRKGISNNDTMNLRAICYLKSAPEDPLKVHHNIISMDRTYQQVYDGSSILNVNLADSSSLTVNTGLYGHGFVKGNVMGRLVRYNVFVDSLYSNKLSDTFLIDTQVEEAIFENTEVYSVVLRYGKIDMVDSIQSKYYVRKSDFFPIGFEEALSVHNAVQYTWYSLSNIAINPVFSGKLFNVDYNTLYKDKASTYAPKVEESLLKKGSLAPAINAKTIMDKDFNLENYRGKIVILDFWFCSCVPCVLALPELQKMAASFDPSEVVFVGVNPTDKKDKIITFLDKKNISYTNVYNSKNVANNYKVVAYPTLYIIDKEGKVHSSHRGWSEGAHNEIIEAINSVK